MSRVAEVVEQELDGAAARRKKARKRGWPTAMRYATLGGGKRMRAFLVMEGAALFWVVGDLRGARGGLDRDAARLFAGA